MEKSSPEIKGKQILYGFKARMKLKETWADKAADFFTNYFGTIPFLLLNILFFFIWIIINFDIVTGIRSFDPFPFGLLTMIVSLEAIFLSIIVLISQRRESHVAELREEMDFEINLRAEEEITRLLNMVDEIHDHLGLAPEDDSELTEMKQKLNLDEMKGQFLNGNK